MYLLSHNYPTESKEWLAIPGKTMSFGCGGIQFGDVQLNSVRGLHGCSVRKAHHQSSHSFDFVHVWRID
jgi:hypothetical protein